MGWDYSAKDVCLIIDPGMTSERSCERALDVRSVKVLHPGFAVKCHRLSASIKQRYGYRLCSCLPTYLTLHT